MGIAENQICFFGSEREMPDRVRGGCNSSVTIKRALISGCRVRRVGEETRANHDARKISNAIIIAVH